MITLGIITEYNPFHNGHLYHLKKAKDLTGADAVICIMNGNFVQRGTPAIVDKWSRTKMALENGVDLVIELPLFYGIRSAEFFAKGSIKLLSASGIVDYIVFGSESGNIELLTYIAKILVEEPEYFQNRLKMMLRSGYSFPKARELAMLNYLNMKNNDINNIKEIKKVVKEPNNILGIEYIKANLESNSNINTLTIKRKYSKYHDKKLNNTIASATAIRNEIYKNDLSFINKFMPDNSYKVLKETFSQGKGPVIEDYLGILIINKLRQLKREELLKYAEIDNGLENRFLEAAHNSGDLKQLIKYIKTKSLTWTRIQRNLLHILFGLKKRDFELLDASGPNYIRVLGFNKMGEDLLAKIKANSPLPLVTQPAKYLKEININSQDSLIKSLSYDILATNIYSLLYPEPDNRISYLDFRIPVIKY